MRSTRPPSRNGGLLYFLGERRKGRGPIYKPRGPTYKGDGKKGREKRGDRKGGEFLSKSRQVE